MNANNRPIWIGIGAVALAFPLLVWLGQSVFHIEFNYTLSIVALGGALLGLVSGVLGCFAVLRQQSLLGDTLSHAALPGVALAFLFAGRDLGVLLIGAGIAGWVGVWWISAITQTTRIKQDSALALVLATFFAFGLALLSYIQGRGDASQAGLDKFIFGQAAALRREDILLLVGIGSVAFAILIAFWKEFKLITFNREFAEANGFNVRFLEGLLSLLIVLAIVMGLQLAGVILMVGLLIAPAVAARQWTNSLTQMAVLSGLLGAFAGASGAVMSGLDVGLPTGPLIIVVASVVVAVALVFAPRRGVLWVWMQQQRDNRRFASLNLLRDLYSHARQHQNLSEPMKEKTLLRVRGGVAQVGLKELLHQHWIAKQGDSYALTAKGIEFAQADARNQELWQLYRRHNEALDLPIVHEDRNVNIDDLLPREAIRKLEQLRESAVYGGD